MRVPKFSLPVIIAGFALTFLLAGSLSAKERGLYFHGGLSYWNDVHRWENDSFFVATLPGFSTTGWRMDGSASQLSGGIGFNFNKNWSIEAIYTGLPNLILPGTHWLIPSIEPDDEPVSASWTASKHDGNFRGVSVIYDHYLSERVSIFLKVGTGTIGVDAKKKLNSTLTDAHRVLLDEQIPDSVLLEGERFCDGCRPRAGTQVYSIGIRMPLLHYTKVSVTVAYQLVEKRVWEWDEGAYPPGPPGWRKQLGPTAASTVEIGIQWSL